MKDLVENSIKTKIYTLRGVQVMLDRDLAELYGVETRVLKQAVKRNIERFPDDFMFELTDLEIDLLVSQSVIPSKKLLGGAKPFAFSEQGVAGLSGILTSKIAIEANISILRAFVSMRRFLLDNASVFQRFAYLEQKVIAHDKKLEFVLEALEGKSLPTQGIFYDGQIYDAYSFINDLLKSAKSEVVLIDNYIDESVFTLFSKYQDLRFTIHTNNITKQLKLDYEKYKKQYSNVDLKSFKSSHDRFLILDKQEIYHIGASLKDLGKRWFAFSKIDLDAREMLERL
ncbi:MAG: ORF6N domain-containing protein [Sulfuricurvum sp.]